MHRSPQNQAEVWQPPLESGARLPFSGMRGLLKARFTEAGERCSFDAFHVENFMMFG